MTVVLEWYCIHNQRYNQIHTQKLVFTFTDIFALSTRPSFLPIPFLFLNGENSSFSSDFWGLFWAWQKRKTHRGTLKSVELCTAQKQERAPDKNRKLQHLEVFLAAAGGLCQTSLSILPGAAPEHCGALLAQEHTWLQEGELPSSTCPKQDTSSTLSSLLGTPLPVLCLYSWAPAAQKLDLYCFTAVEDKNHYFLK